MGEIFVHPHAVDSLVDTHTSIIIWQPFKVVVVYAFRLACLCDEVQSAIVREGLSASITPRGFFENLLELIRGSGETQPYPPQHVCETLVRLAEHLFELDELQLQIAPRPALKRIPSIENQRRAKPLALRSVLGVIDGSELQEVAEKDNLHPAERLITPSHRGHVLGHPVEEFPSHHAHLVNHENVVGLNHRLSKFADRRTETIHNLGQAKPRHTVDGGSADGLRGEAGGCGDPDDFPLQLQPPPHLPQQHGLARAAHAGDEDVLPLQHEVQRALLLGVEVGGALLRQRDPLKAVDHLLHLRPSRAEDWGGDGRDTLRGAAVHAVHGDETTLGTHHPPRGPRAVAPTPSRRG